MTTACSRRGFLAGAAALAGAAGCMTASKAPKGRYAVFISDLHVRAGESYQKDRLAKVVDAILAMDPLPSNVVVFGDIAYHCGLPEEYATSKPLLMRLADAGIRLSFGMGNHDRRSAFFESWPEYRSRTLLPGHLVTRTDLGAVDLLMIDGLQGTDDRARTDMGPVSGAMSREHQLWLKDELERLTKPTFVASHYTFGDRFVPNEMDLLGQPLMKALIKCPMVVGYIHGHAHRWYQEVLHDGWGDGARVFRTACLPSTGHWGDIGYAIFTAESGRAELRLVQDDYFFPSPLPDEKAPHLWKSIVEENRNRSVHWEWQS